jgi:hypothetical protein
MFTTNKKPDYLIFNKKVSEKLFNKIWGEFNNIVGVWYPKFNNLFELYSKNGSEWEKTPIYNAKAIQKEQAWADMPKAAIEYLKSLNQFNAKIFFDVTGIKVEMPRKKRSAKKRNRG